VNPEPPCRCLCAVGLAAGLLVLWCDPPPAKAQQRPTPHGPTPAPTAQGAYFVPAAGLPAVPTEADLAAAHLVDLPTALRLAQTNNLDIAQAREVVAQSQAAFDRARAQLLPSLTLGSTYVDHDGRIQQAIGNILNTNRNSLYVGGGPTLTVQLSDAFFAPLAARQLVAATSAGAARVTNDTLLTVAETYFSILRARRRLARVEETLYYLSADQRLSDGTRFKGLLPLVRDYVQVGGREALASDLARVEVEIARRLDERLTAAQELRIAAAELARLLRLDPTVALWPVEDFRRPLALPGEGWFERGLDDLATFALNNRPETAENRALVQAALEALRAAQWRPLIPSVNLNYNAGGFGGSPNFVQRDPNNGLGAGRLTQSGQIAEFGSRADFDVALVWRLQNLGLGNLADIRERRSFHEQTLLRQAQVFDRIVAQVVQAREQVQRGQERVELLGAALFDADRRPGGPVFRSLRLNFERIRGGEGRPLEALDAVRGLSDTLEGYGQAATDYDRARLRLLLALGLPPQALVGPSAGMPPPVRAPGAPRP